MSSIHPATDDIIAFLNRMVELDRNFVTRLIGTRVQCNRGIGVHPSIQTRATSSPLIYQCSILGVLNGFCGVYGNETDNPRLWGCGPITAILDDEKQVIRFERTDRVRTDLQPASAAVTER